MAPIFKDGIRARKVYFVEDHANGCTTVMTEALYTVCRGVDNGTLDLEKEWRSWIERMLTWLQLLLYLLPTTLTYCMFHDNLLNVLWFIYFIYFKSNNSSSEDIRGDKNNKKKLHVDRDINSATQQQHRRTSKEQNGTSEQSTGSPHLQTYFLFRQVLISPQYLPKKSIARVVNVGHMLGSSNDFQKTRQANVDDGWQKMCLRAWELGPKLFEGMFRNSGKQSNDFWWGKGQQNKKSRMVKGTSVNLDIKQLIGRVRVHQRTLLTQ